MSEEGGQVSMRIGHSRTSGTSKFTADVAITNKLEQELPVGHTGKGTSRMKRLLLKTDRDQRRMKVGEHGCGGVKDSEDMAKGHHICTVMRLHVRTGEILLASVLLVTVGDDLLTSNFAGLSRRLRRRVLDSVGRRRDS